MQVTVQQGDAADEATIEGLCKQALQEEGRLDVFFANVGSSSARSTRSLISGLQAGVATIDGLHDTSADQFMRIMRVNALSYVVPPTIS